MMLFRRSLCYLFAFKSSKQMFNALLPRFIRSKIASGLGLDTGPFNRPIDDVRLISIQPDSYLAVYYKRYDTGVGPGVSLYIHENEILRFDCFGKGRGHYHSLPCLSALPSDERIGFTAETIKSQVNETVEETTGNYAAHLGKHFRRNIRDFRFDQACLAAAVAEAHDRMLSAHRRALSTASPPPIDASRSGRATPRSHSSESR